MPSPVRTAQGTKPVLPVHLHEPFAEELVWMSAPRHALVTHGCSKASLDWESISAAVI